ncbi:thiol reductant ABC exporter subunit CydC [uncultured Agrococcus sp.]|uniref:thiol reductant ABC exporter subunit CydC n=1 Tax=uncultured Agrococcus sp. TaxID=382258 RepID=UPI0025F9754B|nr:thiol reductant ABC exporter subunit CydC [uncultured Agrococcus sp.]
MTARARVSASPAALLGRPGRRALAVLLGLAAAKAVSLILIAEAIARMLAALFEQRTQEEWQGALWVGIAGVTLRALTAWAARAVAQRADIETRAALRRELAQRVLRRSDRDVGPMTTLGTRGLDDLEAYFVTYLPAMANGLVVPLVIGARILFADWISAVIIVLVIPLVPFFMILIGKQTRDRVEEATDAILRLSHHLVELARGLPALIGVGRVREPARTLDTLSEEYRRRTMRTLRTVFVSSFALELIATISVAIVAVVVGIRLVYGGMDLQLGLLVLVLAPDCFTPIREAGAAYHAAEDGVAALDRVREVSDAPVPRPIWSRQPASATHRVCAHDVSVRYSGGRAVGPVTFETAPGTATLLSGASGAGKSSILRALAGRIGVAGEDGQSAGGRIDGVDPTRFAWLPQHPETFEATAVEEVVLHVRDEDAAQRALWEVGIRPDAACETMSPGELRRVALARALARVDTGATLLLLDEPTAHLDDRAAELVCAAVEARIARVATVIASHDARMAALCETHVEVGGDNEPRSAAVTGSDAVATKEHAEFRDYGDEVPGTARATSTEPEQDPGEQDPGEQPGRLPLTRALRLLRASAAGATLPMAGAVGIGIGAVLFALAQPALSGWLIVRSAEQPPILFLMTAIVGVRFFGLARSTLRYYERLRMHDAVFRVAGGLRSRLWRALSRAGLRFPRMRRTGTTLQRLVDDVDRVRDLLPRVISPPIIGAAATLVVVVVGLMSLRAAESAVTGPMLLGLGGIVLASVALIAGLAAPLAAVVADRAATPAAAAGRARIGHRFGALLHAADDLAVHGAQAPVLASLDAAEQHAAGRERRAALAQGLGAAIVILAGAGGAVAIAALALHAATAGAVDAKLIALVVFALLALIEPLLDSAAAAQRWPSLADALARIDTTLAHAGASVDDEQEASVLRPSNRPVSLVLDDVTAQWPGASEPVFSGLDVRVESGEWLTVTGPSGAGKSTMLAVIMGHLAPTRGQVEVVDAEGRALHGSVAWCPQDAHLFDSTLRANLALGLPHGGVDDAELVAALQRVGLGGFYERLEEGLDTRVGAGGTQLSGGERRRVSLARTLLTGAPILLLDEPTAHLDEPTSRTLMADLRKGLEDRLVVCVTHDPVAIADSDRLLRLGEPAAILVQDQTPSSSSASSVPRSARAAAFS